MKFCDEKIQKHLLSGGKIKRCNDKVWRYSSILIDNQNALVLADTEEYYTLTKLDLTTDDWEIVEPEYDWDRIIKDKILCEFSDDEDYPDDEKVISILTSINKYKGFYCNSQGFQYKYCKPFNPKDYKIAKNIKDYEK